MLIKIHKAYRPVVAICDKALIGKTFKEDNKKIFLRENFFQGEEKTKEELIKEIKRQQIEDATFNIVGEKSIQIALDCGIISEKGIKKIQGVPIALVLM